MPLRMAITKQSASGESIVIDIAQWNPVTGEIEHRDIEEMKSLAEQALTLTDERLHEMNMRMLRAYNLEQYFPPEVWSMVVSILDILAGRQSADTVARRWQSAIEETRELEAARAAVNGTTND